MSKSYSLEFTKLYRDMEIVITNTLQTVEVSSYAREELSNYLINLRRAVVEVGGMLALLEVYNSTTKEQIK